jgi:hypothetical protein
MIVEMAKMKKEIEEYQGLPDVYEDFRHRVKA